MISLFKRQKWVLVKTFKEDVEVITAKRSTKEVLETEVGIFYFHLFESNKGRRKVEFQCTLSDSKYDMNILGKSLEVYQEKIYRWLNGRIDPDIPRYNQVSEEETFNTLKGHI